MQRAIVFIGAVALMLGLAHPGSATSHALFDAVLLANGRIAFTCPSIPFNGDICTINPDGAGLIDLTPDSDSYDIYPSWSPAGSKIAFTSGRDGEPEIYVMNADGTGVQRLTTSPGTDATPSWSPDGTKIVFSSNRTGDFEIFTMNADGSNQQQLTFELGRDTWPKYSPDGTKIAFGGLRATWAVYTVPATGGPPTKLTPDSLNAADPDWSPDGSRFVFVNNFLTGVPSNIFTMKADGSDIVQLTNNPMENEFNPNWSPDGTKIDFWTTSVIPATEQSALASAAAPPFPGNNQILAAMLAGDIWVMNADGSNLADMTNSPGRLDLHPDWGTNLTYVGHTELEEVGAEII